MQGNFSVDSYSRAISVLVAISKVPSEYMYYVYSCTSTIVNNISAVLTDGAHMLTL